MKKISPAMLKKLTKLASTAQDNAYAPYSNHRVGAAIITKNGKIFAGANCEVAHYKGICGEAAAIAAMASAGEREIAAVVVIGPGQDHLTTPCGDCRQRIREFAALETPIYVMYKNETLAKQTTLSELLPFSFGPDNMGEVGHGPKSALKPKKKIKK